MFFRCISANSTFFLLYFPKKLSKLFLFSLWQRSVPLSVGKGNPSIKKEGGAQARLLFLGDRLFSEAEKWVLKHNNKVRKHTCPLISLYVVSSPGGMASHIEKRAPRQSLTRKNQVTSHTINSYLLLSSLLMIPDLSPSKIWKWEYQQVETKNTGAFWLLKQLCTLSVVILLSRKTKIKSWLPYSFSRGNGKATKAVKWTKKEGKTTENRINFFLLSDSC